jgi:uncharacterized protein YggT (Ycf19 family)
MIKLLKWFALFIFSLIGVLLGLRFFLKLLAANLTTQFVIWIYEVTDPLLNPFTLAFPTAKISSGFVLEFTTLFAIFTYVFIGYLIQELLAAMDGKKQE